MSLPLHERAIDGESSALVRLTENGLVFQNVEVKTAALVSSASLIPDRPLAEGEQYRFHFDMTKCIGCRSCEVACNEQNGNPADINWRRIGELEGGVYPDAVRHYLSMGCNHCLDADCLRGCPVDAYTKDPVTGIVLHSADACIGCSYCVWNCPYSVPQFNPERGVVGKCDMCKGRLEESLEPACVNACPEAAIEIEIVNMAAWRENFTLADSPGMPSALQTVSTTRITLPDNPKGILERVDAGHVRPEHAHLSLVYMTTMMQAVAGTLCVLFLAHRLDTLRLGFLLAMTSAALGMSTMHLGRPAFAYRALKMWRRSWLSREVLLFTLFYGALAAATTCTAFAAMHYPVPSRFINGLDALASFLGITGTVASACIYLVAARPAWNSKHTPADFLLTATLLGALVAAALPTLLNLPALPGPFAFLTTKLAPPASWAFWLTIAAAAAWLLNQGIRLGWLRNSKVFEAHASWSLLLRPRLRIQLGISLLLVALSPVLLASHLPLPALVSGAVGVLLARYLFFVSVVPLNMALTFVRSRHA